MASLDDQGLTIDTQASAFAQLVTRVRQLYDADLVITEASDLGKLLIIFAEANVSNQQFLSTVVDQLDVNNATGVQLIVLGALNGVSPLAATRSTIELSLGGGGVPPPDVSDKRVRYVPTGAVFRIPLNTVIPASGIVNVTATGDSTGPLLALEGGGEDWVIVDGVTGWDAVKSLSDAVPGRDPESQEAFRARVIAAGETNGAATQPAVNEATAATEGVSTRRMLFNRTPLINSDGVKGFHVEGIFSGGTDEAIGLTLLNVLGATTPTQGSVKVTVIDPTDGQPAGFFFSREEVVRVQLRITIDETGAQKARDTDAVACVTNAATAYIAELENGINVSPEVAAARGLAALTPGTATDSSGEARRFGGVFSVAELLIAARERTVTFGDPQPATITTTNFELYNLTAGEKVDFTFGNSNVISAVFSVADFPIISKATAVEVAAVFQAATDAANAPGTVAAVDGKVVLKTTDVGPLAEVEILGTSDLGALVTLGLSVGAQTGTDSDIEVVFI